MVEEVVLWCRDGTSDKLWGVADYQGRAITFWGRRNKELAFKLLSSSEQAKLHKTIEKKRKDRCYKDSSFDELEAETPGFKAEFDQMLLVAILGDGFKHTSLETLQGN